MYNILIEGEEVRFSTPLDDVVIKEHSIDNMKKYYIEVSSKTG